MNNGNNPNITKTHFGIYGAAVKNGKILLIKKTRGPYTGMYDLPGGSQENGESYFDTLKRELKEETGCTADRYTFLGRLYPSPGYTSEVISIYLAEGLHEGEQKLDEDEFLGVEKIPLDKAEEMVMNNEIYDSKTQTAILKIANIVRNRK
jgi:ADP-ribose pyrophosphatase